MGAQQVLRTARTVIAIVVAGSIASITGHEKLAQAAPHPEAGPRLHEKVAVVDLGPADNGLVRRRLATAVVAAGFDPVIGDGIEDALAGIVGDNDTIQLAGAMVQAERAFGALQCSDATAAAHQAIMFGAARQASGLVVPELSRAWAYVLLCADRAGDLDAATTAASRLQALGGAAGLVDPAIASRYPVLDFPASGVVEIELASDTPKAHIWVDHIDRGVSPVKVVVGIGDHVFAAGVGNKRAAMPITVGPKGGQLSIPLVEQATKWSEVAQRVASWGATMPSPEELAWVLGKIHTRVALVRHGDIIEAWGQIGRAEKPHRIGDDDGSRNLVEVDRVLALIADRVHTWNDHAPDPDRPLLTENREEMAEREKEKHETKWWVYATILGAVATALTIVYVHDQASDTQHVELHYP